MVSKRKKKVYYIVINILFAISTVIDVIFILGIHDGAHSDAQCMLTVLVTAFIHIPAIVIFLIACGCDW